MSNSNNMSVVEKLTQHIKDTGLSTLMDGDEDAINELSKQAIHEALFKERTISKGYGSYETKQSKLVEVATEKLEKLLDEMATNIVKQLMEDPVNREIVMGELVRLLPLALVKAMQGSLYSHTLNEMNNYMGDTKIKVGVLSSRMGL